MCSEGSNGLSNERNKFVGELHGIKIGVFRLGMKNSFHLEHCFFLSWSAMLRRALRLSGKEGETKMMYELAGI